MRIAIIFDKLVRPDTTGVYCERALQALGHEVRYYPPLFRNGDKQVCFAGYTALDPYCDLYLQIDDDLSYPGPIHCKPSAYWCIDTHRFHAMVGGWSREQKARGFDHIFSAQKDGVAMFKALGFPNAHWLPLAFDRHSHFQLDHAIKRYDWCFIGHINPARQDFLRALSRRWPNCFVGQAFGWEMVQIYNQSKIIFNYSIGQDLNMRLFEAMACGGLLITNRVNNGEEELFGDTLITYASEAELIAQFDFFLRNDPERNRIAAQHYHGVQQQHTYERRMALLIDKVREPMHGKK